MGVVFMDRTVAPTEWKPQDSTGNHWQASLGLVGEVPRAHRLDAPHVERASFSGVLNEACKHSGLDDHEIADRIHISHGYMSKFMRGVGQQWAKRLIAFMRVTNSLAPLQWMADQMGCDLTVRCAVSAELAAARARVAELERDRRAAA
jgi:transcriptional regulator with XRE-family HTH domain